MALTLLRPFTPPWYLRLSTGYSADFESWYITHEAIDAPGAMTIERELGHIDLLVTDMGLSGTHGRQLAEMIHERRPNSKILFITGDANTIMVKSDFLAEGMDMLAKPFTIDALAHQVKAMLGS